MTTILIILSIWLLLSLPCGVILGRWIKYVRGY